MTSGGWNESVDRDGTDLAVAEVPCASIPHSNARHACGAAANRLARRTSAAMLVAAAACFAALAAPFFAGRVYVANDLGQFHLPLRAFYAEQLASGQSFDWMPGLYGGFYVSGEGQLGGYHPWHWLLYRLLPLRVAFGVEVLANYQLLFAGTYWWLRRLVGRRDAALLGALAFTFGGFSLLHFVHPNAIGVVAHLPWLLVAIDVALTAEGRWQRGLAEAAVALFTASQILLGYPQYVWFSLVAEVAFAAWRGWGRPGAAPRLAVLAVSLALGAMVGAVQWMATWHLLGQSTRDCVDAAFANSGSLHPLNLVQLVAPYLFRTRVVGQNTHELGLYAGAVPIVLCVWLVAQRGAWGRYRSLVRALLIFGGISLLLAAGEFGGLYRLQAYLPLANRFRFPCRGIVLVQLCIAGGAAVAGALLFSSDAPTCRRRGRRALAGTFLASVMIAAVGPLVWPAYVARPLAVWSGPLLVGAAASAVLLVEARARGTSMLLAGLLAGDLALYGLSFALVGGTARLDDYAAGIVLPPGGSGQRVVAPAAAAGPRVGNAMLLAGIRRADGYAGLEPARRLDPRDRSAWQRAGAAWAWLETDAAERSWVCVSPTAPRARLVSKTLEPDGGSALEQAGLDTVVAEPPVPLAGGAPGTATVVCDVPGRLTIETFAPGDQCLVTTESFDSGWRATLDGRPQPIVRIDGDFLGCAAAAGKHCVEFEFCPPARWLGRAVSICGLGLLGLASAACAWARRPRTAKGMRHVATAD